MHLRQQVAQPTNTSYRYIPLTQNQIAIVDAEDYDWISQWNWYALWNLKIKRFYACRMAPQSQFIYMHRLVMKARDGEYVDHIHQEETLNNRKENLRTCTHGQNMANRGAQRNNSSGFKGVSWDKSRGLWVAQIMVNKKHIGIGRYETKEAAAKAYDDAARYHFGEFAQTNFNIPQDLR
jgi:AP2 domain